MKRKYPISFFIGGLLINLAKYIFIGLAGVIFLIIGFFGVNICKIIGMVILVGYSLLCIIEQIAISIGSLKESSDPELNKFLDNAFGVQDQDEATRSSSQRIIDWVEEKIKSQNDDENKGDS